MLWSILFEKIKKTNDYPFSSSSIYGFSIVFLLILLTNSCSLRCIYIPLFFRLPFNCFFSFSPLTFLKKFKLCLIRLNIRLVLGLWEKLYYWDNFMLVLYQGDNNLIFLFSFSNFSYFLLVDGCVNTSVNILTYT